MLSLVTISFVVLQATTEYKYAFLYPYFATLAIGYMLLLKFFIEIMGSFDSSPESGLHHALDLKTMIAHNKCKFKSLTDSHWCKVLRTQAMRRRRRMICRKHRRSLMMKRRVLREGYKRPINGIDRRIRTLKKLVPNGKSLGLDLDGLLRETADFIMCLQVKVKIMQTMIKLLSPSDE